MKLFVLKRISAQLPAGTVYDEQNGQRRRVLIAAKLARPATADDARPAAPPGATPTPTPTPIPSSESTPSTTSAEPETAESSTDDTAAGKARRTYRRRDLTPEA